MPDCGNARFSATSALGSRRLGTSFRRGEEQIGSNEISFSGDKFARAKIRGGAAGAQLKVENLDGACPDRFPFRGETRARGFSGATGIRDSEGTFTHPKGLLH